MRELMLSSVKREPLWICPECLQTFVTISLKDQPQKELNTPYPDALRLFNVFNPFKGSGKFISWSNPTPLLPIWRILDSLLKN